MKRWSSSRLAWSLAVVAFISIIAGIVLEIRYAAISGDTGSLLTHTSLAPFITAGYVVVGSLVASRHPRNPIGWLFLAVGLLSSLTVLILGYNDYIPTIAADGVFPANELADWLGNWLWIPTVFLPTVFVFLLFPDGRLPSPRWRIVLWSAALGLTLTILAVALHPGPMSMWDMESNPYGISEAARTLDSVAQVANLFLLVGFVGSIAAFVIRYRRSKGIERAQMKWLLYALSLMLVVLVFEAVIWFSLADKTLATELGITLTNLSILGIVVAAGIAITRYRLYDIDLVINRTVVYGSLTVSVVAVYALVVGGLGALFQSQGNLVIAILATGLVAVLFQPLRDRLQRGVNRLFYGQRDEPLRALSKLGRRLEAAISPDVVLPTLVDTIPQTMRLPYVAIALRAGGENSVVAKSGVEVPDTLRLPLIYQGDEAGQLIAGPRAIGEPFSRADRRLLEGIAHQAGPAVHAVQLTAALQQSRFQLVTTREEERRRLRRDLHDGLGATLAALQLEVGALKRAIRGDPDKAEALADEFRADIRATIEDIRRLVYELRPPTLDQLGLVAAVRAQAIQSTRSGDSGRVGGEEPSLEVRIEAPEELPPLPAAVEVAAYRITQEALTNVVHHAQARHCLVRLEMADELRVEIVDDGVGVAYGRQGNGGLGLLSMRERAVELGGSCVVQPAPGGGTRVIASLPLVEA
jgi:signal transduction histidine kinase